MKFASPYFLILLTTTLSFSLRNVALTLNPSYRQGNITRIMTPLPTVATPFGEICTVSLRKLLIILCGMTRVEDERAKEETY
nr:hypothetical protein BSM_27100 [uncultured archaeon]CBH39702.1 hypothetical protein BSM_31810 [uncultured archaeon]